jgi:hypothetical protein
MTDKLTEKDKLDAVLESWKVAVDTQRHFNDVAMKIRHFGFVLLAAIFGAVAFSLKSQFTIELLDYNVPIGSFIMLFGAIIWLFIYFLDTKWYSPFLLGAVKTGIKLEAKLDDFIPGAFSHSSDIKLESNKVKIFGFKVDSEARSNIFHRGMIVVISILSILILFTSTKVDTSNAAAVNIKTSSNHYSPPVIEKVEVADPKNSKVIVK